MIYLPSIRIAYLDPPRTGTTLINDLLVRGCDGVRVAGHWAPPPWQWAGWRWCVSVRHPVTRAWSLFKHRRQHVSDLHPLDFARSLVDRTAWWWDSWTCSDWARPYGATPIRLENLAGDLAAAIGGDAGLIETPVVNGLPDPFPMPDGFAWLALQWGVEDLGRFGYDEHWEAS